MSVGGKPSGNRKIDAKKDDATVPSRAEEQGACKSQDDAVSALVQPRGNASRTSLGHLGTLVEGKGVSSAKRREEKISS